MDHLRFPEWQKPYLDALVELDPEKLPERVASAETAIIQRMEQFTASPDSEVERRAVKDALDALYVLKRDKLNFPDWRPK